MAKALSGRERLSRLHDQGYTDKQIAQVTGWSKSSIGAMRRGEQATGKADAAIREFYGAGKRAKETFLSGQVTLPSAKEARPPSVWERAKGLLKERFDNDEKVVATIKYQDGSRQMLYQHGGIEAGEIKNVRRDFGKQAKRQSRGNKGAPAGGLSESPPFDIEIDWNDVADIEFEAY